MFIQMIEMQTSRADEIQALVDEWREKTGTRRTAQRSTLTADRDHPGTYVTIVEFPSYEDAMANSALPETAALAQGLAKLCDAPPTFRNLDVQQTFQL